jgi:uncharacterized membrane protein (DUF485 family)
MTDPGVTTEHDGTATGPGADGPHDAAAPGSAARRRLRCSLRPAAIFVASRAVVLLLAGAVGVAEHHPFIEGLTAWDSKWYLQIAGQGYVHAIPPGTGNPAQSDLGFFPAMPMAMRLTHAVTGLGYTSAGPLTGFVLGLAAAVAVWWLLHDVFGVRGADRGTTLIFFSPGAFVLSMVYSEPVTILFVSLCLLALRRHRWVGAGLAAAVASAADPVAVAVVAPCVVAAVQAVRARGEWRAVVAPVLAPLGVVSFFTYLWVHTGSPFEWFRAQRAGWQGGTYFGSVPGAFVHVVEHGFADLNYAVKMCSFLVAVGLVVLFVRARPPAIWVAYVATVFALGILSPIIGVTPRLLVRNFPLLGVVGARLPTFWFELVLGCSALLLACLATVSMGTPLFTP